MKNITYAQYVGPHVIYDHKMLSTHNDEALIHAHSWCEITFVKQGKFSYMVGDQNYEIVGESILLFNRAGQVHSILFNDSFPCERHHILFDHKMIFQELCERVPEKIQVLNYERNNVVQGLFEKLEFYFQSFETVDFADLLDMTIKELLYNLIVSENSWEIENKYLGSAIMKNAISYIDENITDDISIEELCENLFVTKSHLHRLFVENLKVTPKKYILSKKMSLAQRRLCRGEKATDVAHKLGYGDYSTFFRAYKKHFGHSPSDEIVIDKIMEVRS